MKAVYALYDTGIEAQRAVDRLRGTGLSDSRITVITGQPMEDFEFSHIGSKNNLWVVASSGGAFGLLFGIWLTSFMEQAWPINVGNMSIVTWWPNIVVTFELTMLCAILATVVTLIASSGLVRRRPALYDPEVTNGKILVGVEDPQSGSEGALEQALLVSPGARFKTL